MGVAGAETDTAGGRTVAGALAAVAELREADRMLADAQDADDGGRSFADGRMIERPVPEVRGGAFVGVLSVSWAYCRRGWRVSLVRLPEFCDQL